MVCVVVSRNGEGDVYTFKDKKSARLHPVVQLYDVVAEDASELANQYGRDEIDSLLRFAEGRDKSRLIDAMERWKSDPGVRRLPPDESEILWRLCIRAAKPLPLNPVDLINIIEEDRRFLEQKPIRSRPESTVTGDFSPIRSLKGNAMNDAVETKKPRAERIKDDYIITMLKDDKGVEYGVENNPKRAGTATHGRFQNYKTGITVGEAKKAGLTAGDVSYDVAHGFISVDPPAAPAAE